MKTVAFVPIRLNSKRVESKNLRLLAGKPLMCYVMKTLVSVPSIDEVYCYCSDGGVVPLLPEGVRFLRRDKLLDSDQTLGQDIYDAFVSQVDADIYVLAHATSPFVRATTVAEALSHVVDGSHDSAFSVERMQTFAWYEGRPLNYRLSDIPRTQDIEPVYVETSAFFIFRRQVWTKMHQRIGRSPYMAVVDRVEGVDIDWPEDFEFAERIAESVLR